jgi:hypothetical protein
MQQGPSSEEHEEHGSPALLIEVRPCGGKEENDANTTAAAVE